MDFLPLQTEGCSGSRAGRGEVAGMDRIRPTKRSYNYQNRVQRYKKNLIYASIGD